MGTQLSRRLQLETSALPVVIACIFLLIAARPPASGAFDKKHAAALKPAHREGESNPSPRANVVVCDITDETIYADIPRLAF